MIAETFPCRGIEKSPRSWQRTDLSVPRRTLAGVANELPPLLRAAAERQAGVVTSGQAARAGLEWSAVEWRLRTGRWQRIYRGVYATFSGELSRRAKLWAAVLYSGPGALLSHRTAAELAGLTDSPSESIHVTVPVDRRVTPAAGIVVHRSARASEVLHPARLPPQSRIEETVLDLVHQAGSLDDAVGWVTRALGRRLTTQDRLRAALAQRARQRWRRELTELLSPDLVGLMSVLERRYQRDVERRHGLPAGARQVQARRKDRTEYRDVLYEDYATCVELDGRLAHPGEQRWRDIRRDNAVAADGGVTLRYGWLDVTAWSCQTAAEVYRALRARGFTGGRPCSPACPVTENTDTRPLVSPVLRIPAEKRRRPGQPPAGNSAGPGRSRTSSRSGTRTANAAD
jgi:Transcriptional regulator, AbiEi antitoxin